MFVILIVFIFIFVLLTIVYVVAQLIAFVFSLMLFLVFIVVYVTNVRPALYRMWISRLLISIRSLSLFYYCMGSILYINFYAYISKIMENILYDKIFIISSTPELTKSNISILDHLFPFFRQHQFYMHTSLQLLIKIWNHPLKEKTPNIFDPSNLNIF